MSKLSIDNHCLVQINLNVKLKDGEFRVNSFEGPKEGMTVEDLGHLLDDKLGNRFGDSKQIIGYIAKLVIRERTKNKKSLTKASDSTEYDNPVSSSEVIDDIWFNFNF